MTFRIPGAGAVVPQTPVLSLDGIDKFIVGREILAHGITGYEPDTLSAAVAAHEAIGGRQFMDVGANIGVYALVMKVVFGDLIDVQAFEPLPLLADTARRLATDNGLAVDVQSKALADYEGEATLYVSARSDSSNSLAQGFRRAKSELQVPVTTIDAVCGGCSANFMPSLIKIDTESTEPAVLRGARKYIASRRPWLIIEILTGRTETQVEEFMRHHGYHFHKITGEQLVPVDTIFGDEEHRDWLFSPMALDERFHSTYARWREAFHAAETVAPLSLSAQASQ